MRVISQDGKVSFDSDAMFLQVIGTRIVASNSMDESKNITIAQYRTPTEATTELTAFHTFLAGGEYLDDNVQQVVADSSTTALASYQFHAASFYDMFTITFVAGEHGSLTGTTTQTVQRGGSCTAVTAVPATGYVFSGWSTGAETAELTITNVQASATITASFAVATFTLTYTAGENGSITGTSPQTVNYGESGSAVTAVPDTGYDFEKWSDGVMTAERTDTNVTADVTVTASFVIKTFTLTYTAGENGSITGTSPQTVNYGADGSAVTAVPRSGYVFDKWSDDVMTAERTDTNVTANITVTASFVSEG